MSGPEPSPLSADETKEDKAAADDVLRAIVRYYARPEYEFVPKHQRIYRAVSDAIGNDEIGRLIQLPAEGKMARELGVSLGTAQRALARLAEDGLVVRRHGHGTFVAKQPIPEEELWQFRFFGASPGGSYLPIFARLRVMRHESSQGEWSRALGDDPAGFVYIERLIEVGDAFLCLSRMHLPAGRFAAVMQGKLIEMNPVNIKLLLRREFGAHTTRTQQIIRFVRLNREEAELINQEEGSMAIRLEARGSDQAGLPISYHEVVIPPSGCTLDVSFSGSPTHANWM